jgi:hypothetical protein
MADSMSFLVDVENYLSFSYQEHLSRQLSMSLSNPKVYEESRQTILKRIRNDNVKRIYLDLMSVMTTGCPSGSTNPIVAGIVPGMPKQECAKFCLSAAETLNQVFTQCVDQILPPAYSKVALQRDSDLGKAIGIPTAP